MIGPLLNIKCPSVRGKLRCVSNQLVRRTIKYSCPMHRFVAGTHVGKMHVLQFKCLRVENNACTLVKWQIYENLKALFSLIVTKHWPGASTERFLVRRTPFFGNVENICDGFVLNNVTRTLNRTRMEIGRRDGASRIKRQCRKKKTDCI